MLAGGLRDWSGNAAPTTFRSRFSTGAVVNAIVPDPQINAAAIPGQAVKFDVDSVTGPGPFQYSWDFGDGAPPTPFSNASAATHAYGAAGHYAVVVSVTNGSVLGTASFVQTVHRPLTSDRPTRSSTVAVDEARGRVWCVNPDHATVTAVDADSLAKLVEVGVGDHPRTLAIAPDGTVWVACQDAGTVWVLDGVTGARIKTIPLPYASAPYGIAMSPDGAAAYVTLQAVGRVAKLDPVARRLVATAAVGAEPRAVAVAADSERILVTRFRSVPGGDAPDRLRGEVYQLSASAFARTAIVPLAFDPGPDTEASGRGVPNYLGAVAISPDGQRAWVASKKDNVARGAWRSGEALNFESTVRTIVSQIDLDAGAEALADRIDFNDRDLAVAVAFSPLGDYAFTALQGSNAIDVRDAYSGALVAGIDGTGLAPQGLALRADGSALFVHNFMSRSLSAYDARGVSASTSFALPALGSVSTVSREVLSPQELLGKQIFYNAADPRMNEDGYISCASCHLDGGEDGQVWDFTDRGEGLRNTISLLGRGGMGHGNVHWTANFDEIQDFENDIRGGFGGDGFMDDLMFGSGNVANPMGHPKAGLSPELDALAAYVSSLTTFGKSPYRDSGGGLTEAGARGKQIFERLDCASCHAGAAFTDSATGARHDVGTILPSSGSGSGAPLAGLDTPTLRGLWNSAPYLHDGSAQTLMDVLTRRNRLGKHFANDAMTPAQRRDLVAYLLQIDDLEPAPR